MKQVNPAYIFKKPMFWTFNVSPTFMSLPSDYKTLGLRNIEIQPVNKVNNVFLLIYIRKEYNVYEVVDDGDGNDVRGAKNEEESAHQQWLWWDIIDVNDDVGSFCAKVEEKTNEWIDDKNNENGYIKGDLGWIKKPNPQAPPPEEEEEEDEELIDEDKTTINLFNCYVVVTYDQVLNTIVFRIVESGLRMDDEGEEILYYINVQPSVEWLRDQMNSEQRTEFRDDLFLFDHEKEKFFNFLNLEIPVDDANVTQLTDAQVFHNVWNHKTLFIHSSFSLNEYGYLGSENEFYTKPSKLFKYDGRSPDIRLWASLDGKNPVILHNVDFSVELELIANVKYPNKY
jgi:hypothetical protein